MNTWKDIQHHSLLKKCKSKLKWDITSHHSECPSSKSLWTINAGEHVEMREHSCTVVGNVNWYSHCGRWYGNALKKVLLTRNKTTIQHSNPTPRFIPREIQNWKRHMYPVVRCSTFTIARSWKQPICPSTDEWMNKLWYRHTVEYYSAIKRNAFKSVLMRWMNLEPIIQSKVSQKEKDKYHILTHTLEKEMPTHSSILAWKIPNERGPW